MRKLIAFFAAAILAAGVASLGIAVEKMKVEHKLIGQVVSVDPTAMLLTAKEVEKKGQTAEITFNVEPQAKVMIHGKSGKLEELKAGDAVTVKYVTENGKHLAKAIEHV